jgi:serine/threonine-protein kinase HipA
LLAKIGKDCVGAIQICTNETKFHKKIQAEILDKKTIAAILKNYHNAPLGMSNNNDDFRISIAGAQEKSAFLLHDNKWCRPLGTTPTSHIFKLPIGFIKHQHMDLSDSCENEWLCTQIAQAFNLPVANANIQHFKNVKALVVERFDRRWSKKKQWLMRLPQEDCCQALGISPNLKYEADGGPGIIQIMQLLLGSDNAIKDREIFFQSQILFILLAAIDGHAKNFSLFIGPRGDYHLTPLYDIMSAHPLLANKQLQPQKIKMAMALIGKNKHYHWHKIKRRHFISTAKAAKFSPERAQDILQTMLNQVEQVIKNVSQKFQQSFPNILARVFSKVCLKPKKICSKSIKCKLLPKISISLPPLSAWLYGSYAASCIGAFFILIINLLKACQLTLPNINNLFLFKKSLIFIYF